MTHPVLEAEIAALVEALEEATANLKTETSVLQRTITHNRGDVYGMTMRVGAIRDRADRLGQIGAKLAGFHDLRYKILAGHVDQGEGSAVEETCPPTTPPPPPPSTPPSPAGRKSTPS